MTATGPSGTVTAQAPVTVTVPPPTVELTVLPTNITSGESSTLKWNTQYAETCILQPDGGQVPCTGLQKSHLNRIPPTPSPPLERRHRCSGSNSNRSSPKSHYHDHYFAGRRQCHYPKDVMVSGTVTHSAGLETGVVVNGVRALVYGNQFVANHVLIQHGANTITVQAVDVHAASVEKAIFLSGTTPASYIELHADTENDLAAMQTTLRFSTNFPHTSRPALTYYGPAEVSFLTPVEEDTWIISISEPGIYTFNVEAVDESGNKFTDNVAVMAINRIAIDTLLQSKWNGMKEALLLGQVSDALSFFHEESRAVYQKQFDLMTGSGLLAPIVNRMGQLRLVEHDGFGMIYDLRTEREGSEFSFQVLFVQGKNGIWRIKNF